MSIQLVDYNGGYTTYYGSLKDAEDLFSQSAEYWKLLVDWSVYLIKKV